MSLWYEGPEVAGSCFIEKSMFFLIYFYFLELDKLFCFMTMEKSFCLLLFLVGITLNVLSELELMS